MVSTVYGSLKFKGYHHRHGLGQQFVTDVHPLCMMRGPKIKNQHLSLESRKRVSSFSKYQKYMKKKERVPSELERRASNETVQ
jgi:hypothetical protein